MDSTTSTGFGLETSLIFKEGEKPKNPRITPKTQERTNKHHYSEPWCSQGFSLLHHRNSTMGELHYRFQFHLKKKVTKIVFSFFSMGAPVMVELEGETDPLQIALKELK